MDYTTDQTNHAIYFASWIADNAEIFWSEADRKFMYNYQELKCDARRLYEFFIESITI